MKTDKMIAHVVQYLSQPDPFSRGEWYVQENVPPSAIYSMIYWEPTMCKAIQEMMLKATLCNDKARNIRD